MILQVFEDESEVFMMQELKKHAGDLSLEFKEIERIGKPGDGDILYRTTAGTGGYFTIICCS